MRIFISGLKKCLWPPLNSQKSTVNASGGEGVVTLGVHSVEGQGDA